MFPDTTRMNLSQKINCFKIAKTVDKIRNKKSYHENLKLVVYYLLKGLNEKREEKITEINNLFEINNYYDDKANNSPIELKKEANSSFINSKFNELIFNINPEIDANKNARKENQYSNLIFTNKIKEIIDAIHFSLSTKTPLILEGGYGQGKKSAIEYYAKMSQLELISVPISKSTKVDDLLCKATFKKNEKGNFILVNAKTPLCQAIECKGNFSILFKGTIASIGNYGFYFAGYGCKGTSEIDIPCTVPSIGDQAFNGVSGVYFDAPKVLE